jgi:hypothetical protein
MCGTGSVDDTRGGLAAILFDWCACPIERFPFGRDRVHVERMASM